MVGVVSDVHDRAEELLARAYAGTLELVPEGGRVFDAHVHVGDDIDGFSSRREELLAFLAKSDAAGAFFFCLDEPDREPAFTAANDRTLADAALEGRGVGSAGLDKAADYIAAQFERVGLSPAGNDGFMQPLEVTVGAKLAGADQQSMSVGDVSLALDTQWRPFSFSRSGDGGNTWSSR